MMTQSKAAASVNPIELALGQLAETQGDPTDQIYALLFQKYPEMEAVFDMDRDGGVRGSMLSQAFECLMDLAGTGQLAETVIRAERMNHDAYDVPAGMFEVFFSIIRDVTRDALGPSWTEDMNMAWTQVLEKADQLSAPSLVT
ncbi:globin [Hyphomonas pacifica]|uniref:globin n=1 Tax=Hyphomonas pacifica TaxID=1280941 RepID=UPI0013146BEA|nr:globin [Hyphomonas pacifica]